MTLIWVDIWEQLIRDNQVIPATNRAQIYDDFFNLPRADIISYANALSLTKLVYAK